MHRLTFGSRRTLRTFAVQAAVLTWKESPVHRYQFGVSCGPPLREFVARTALGIVFRNSACRSGLGLGTVSSGRSQAQPKRASTSVSSVYSRRVGGADSGE